ncbi:MAG: hypothetical protein KJ709_09095 [Nanoarchaeota archaeon]|nr:hypothetical protein [Nanoarchaeota archaeon]
MAERVKFRIEKVIIGTGEQGDQVVFEGHEPVNMTQLSEKLQEKNKAYSKGVIFSHKADHTPEEIRDIIQTLRENPELKIKFEQIADGEGHKLRIKKVKVEDDKPEAVTEDGMTLPIGDPSQDQIIQYLIKIGLDLKDGYIKAQDLEFFANFYFRSEELNVENLEFDRLKEFKRLIIRKKRINVVHRSHAWPIKKFDMNTGKITIGNLGKTDPRHVQKFLEQEVGMRELTVQQVLYEINRIYISVKKNNKRKEFDQIKEYLLGEKTKSPKSIVYDGTHFRIEDVIKTRDEFKLRVLFRYNNYDIYADVVVARSGRKWILEQQLWKLLDKTRQLFDIQETIHDNLPKKYNDLPRMCKTFRKFKPAKLKTELDDLEREGLHNKQELFLYIIESEMEIK